VKWPDLFLHFAVRYLSTPCRREKLRSGLVTRWNEFPLSGRCRPSSFLPSALARLSVPSQLFSNLYKIFNLLFRSFWLFSIRLTLLI